MTRRAGDEGVSSVVAAVLLFGLFTTVFALYAIQTLPEWEADNEHNHHREVARQLQGVRASLEALSSRDDAGPVTASVSMDVPTVPMLQQTPASAEVAYLKDDDGFGAAASFTSPVLRLVDNVVQGAPDMDVAGNVHAEVASVHGIVLGLTSSVVGNNDHAFVQVAATDGASTVTARLLHSGQSGSTTCDNTAELRLETTTSSGTTYQPLLCDINNDLPLYRIDVTGAAYTFAAAVARLEPPLTLTFTDGGVGAVVVGTYSAVWENTDGWMQSTGTGQSGSYSFTQSGGRLEYDPSYQSFVDESLSFEGGAVVASQGERQAVVAEPAFALDVDGSDGFLQWTLVQLDGSGALAGARSATITVGHTESSDVVLTATGATFTLTTPNAAAWRSFLAEQVLVAGASAAATVGGSGDMATLTLASSGGVSLWSLHLRLIEGTVQVS
ncbi:MAG: hypothetical protein QOD77_10 [Thermoplasmata archaeon]|jgi:hypothetical protein|nr:hypothetical protein [Thermoplasmata archaeon]